MIPILRAFRVVFSGALVLALFLTVAPGAGAQQTGTITGRITDAQSGQPIASVQVFISGLDVGVLTQQNGRFLLQNVPAGTHTVNAERIGYRTVSAEVSVAGGESVVQNFSLTEEALQLDEVIVTGTPGGTTRRALGNTVAQVEAAEVSQDVAITNMQDLLGGRTPGLQFTRLSGNVGTGSPIKIRGVGSFSQSRNQPLIFVDGIRVNDQADAGPTLGSGDQVSVLDDFNPEDIESIEIIKGPAAASLYGTEASAGVIQIITKRGAEGAPEFNISVRQGTNFMIDPAGRVGTMWTCPTDPSPGPTDCQNEADLLSYNMYDEATRYIADGYFPWPNEDIYQYGHSQSYNLDVRGGTQTIRYFLSGNYDDEEGVIWYNTDETYRLRGNIGVTFSDNFDLSLSTGWVKGNTRFGAPTVSDGGVFQDLVWSNGYYLDRVTPFDNPQANVRLGGFQEHLPSDVAEVQATRDYSRFTGSATLNFTAGAFDVGIGNAQINSRLVVGVDRGVDINRNLFPLHDGIVPEHLAQFTDSWPAVYSETENGEMYYERPIQTNYSFDYSFTADLTVAEAWGFATSFGAQYYVDQQDYFSNDGTGFASTLSTTINQIAQANINTDYEFVENKSLGFYVQEEVGWNDRLFVTGAVRFDDNSTFGTEAPAQTYPKVSATWVISEESFWNLDVVNSLRLRGAWGQSGRQPSATSGQNIYVATRGPAGTSAIRPESPGNPEIEPEVSTELEVGFDAAFLDDRISGEFTYYQRKDEQALLAVPRLSGFGFPGSISQNLGRIDNWGWEAILNTRIYEGDIFSFDLDLTADHTDNEIKSLGSFAGTTNIAIGLPYPNFTLDNRIVRAEFTDGGFYTNSFGESLDAWCDAGVTLAPDGAENPSQYGTAFGGEVVPCQTIGDVNGLHGRAFATHTFSVAPRLTFLDGSLQVFALAEGQYGRLGMDHPHQSTHIYNGSKISRLENDAWWVADDRINNDFGGFLDQTPGKTSFDADFWKLREVGARYQLPESLIQSTGAERASLAVSARNVWTIWQAQDEIYGMPITDPEYGNPDLDGDNNWWNVPPLASLNATLRITF